MHALKCSKFALDCLETFVGSFRCVKCIRSYCLYTKRTEMTWIRGWSLESSEMVLYLFLGARRCLCPIMIAIAPWPVIQIIELLWETFKSNGQLQTSFACRIRKFTASDWIFSQGMALVHTFNDQTHSITEYSDSKAWCELFLTEYVGIVALSLWYCT